MNNIRRIAIVGAGVAGMALALLARQRGCQVSLYERHSSISTIGAGVTLWPNAMFVLQQMGLKQELEHMGGAPRFMRQFDQSGSRMAEFDIEEVNLLSGFPTITILRRDLMNILARALDAVGVTIHFDSPVTTHSIEALRQEFDLVVGADGRMNSVVRRVLYQDDVPPRYQGFINIIGISKVQQTLTDNAIHDYRSASERFGIVPVKGDWCYWAGAWRAELDKERPLSAWYHELHQRFRHWSGPVQHVLNGCEPASLNRIFVHDIDPLPRWHHGNVVIIGDAAHASLPTSGQGAAQALEDAWHLALLLEQEHEPEHILTTFYQRRTIKTSAAQTVGRQVAQQIFGDAGASPTASPLSAEQLSQFWMQGLTVQE
ncbi:FAD-dependent oxidoreductase [Oceanimonas baumannii]|uniref:FAD-dependent oxidoreductase n=1 Tax=Oceanimonas baumannii TaxID=129578 RepID=UPI003A91DF2D